MKPQADLQQTSSQPALPHTDKTYRERKYWRFYEVVDTVVEEIQNHTWQKTGKAKRRLR